VSVRPSIRPSVSHKLVGLLYPNDWTNRAGFWYGVFHLPILHCALQNLDISKTRVLPSGTLSQTLDFESFATANRSVSKTRQWLSFLTTHTTVDPSLLYAQTLLHVGRPKCSNSITSICYGFVLGLQLVTTVVQQSTRFRLTWHVVR